MQNNIADTDKSDARAFNLPKSQQTMFSIFSEIAFNGHFLAQVHMSSRNRSVDSLIGCAEQRSNCGVSLFPSGGKRLVA